MNKKRKVEMMWLRNIFGGRRSEREREKLNFVIHLLITRSSILNYAIGTSISFPCNKLNSGTLLRFSDVKSVPK